MVNYEEILLEKDKKYGLVPIEELLTTEDKDRLMESYRRTVSNLNKMYLDRRPITIINPERTLTDEESEEYRKYFCKKAKEDKMNYIYFRCKMTISKFD